MSATSSTHLEVLLRKFDEDALFHRLAIGSPTFSEMVAEAIMQDRTGKDYHLATHNAASIDLVARDGHHVRGVCQQTLHKALRQLS